jgi:hypothetical protein
MDRREFCKSALRYLVLALLGAGAGALAWRKGGCTRNGLCKGCPTVAACGDPAALSYKRVTR